MLTYHSMHVAGDAYADNDHHALASDLDTLAREGFRAVALSEVVEAVERDALDALDGCVAITCDDGSDFDFRDLPHPRWGVQRSLLAILGEARSSGRLPGATATAFVIVSPSARQELDRKCMVGRGWWGDDWWAEAERSGLMRVESHGWDHNHPFLFQTRTRAARGGFDVVDEAEAHAEIRDANTHLCATRGRPGPVLFAYPFGDANDYLSKSYFPRGAAFHGVRAAFTTEGVPVSRGASRWRLPRYVFGEHWRTPAQLERILRECRPQRAGPPPGSRDATTSAGLEPRFEEVAAADAAIAALFRRAFNAPPPPEPRHFVARLGDGPASRLGAYIHFTPFEDGVYLLGGLCVDATAYRHLPASTRRLIAEHGSLSRWLITRSIEMLGPKRAVFAYTGNTMSRRDTAATGFVPASGPHLIVQWHGEPPAGRAALIRKVERLGPF